jgi:DNA-binding response OmpR family regulator
LSSSTAYPSAPDSPSALRPFSTSVLRVGGASQPSRRLLLIDDEPDICLLVQAALKEFQGWQVATCQHPRTRTPTDHPRWDAILLEVSITRLAGFALVPVLRADPATSCVPIVLLTSQLRPRDYKRFRQMAVDGVIAKPFDPVTLGCQIAALLGWPEAAQ